MEDIKASEGAEMEMVAPVFQRKPVNYQPNLFTESRQEFKGGEKKIVTLVVNQVGHLALQGKIVPGKDLIITIPFSELTEHNHMFIADSAEALQSRRLIYRNDKTKQLDIITPFPRVRFDLIGRQRVIELTMFSAIVHHFAELGQRYTKYDIDVMLSLSSVYSGRMFEIINMYINRKQMQFSYSVARLLEMLNCPDDYNFNDLRKNALVTAQRELHAKAGINLEWTPRKEGKKIVELTFTIKTAQELASAAVERDRQQISNMPITEAVATAWQLMKNYKLKDWQKEHIGASAELLEIFLRVDSELANGLRSNVKNPTAYLIKSLGIDQLKAPAKPKKTAVTAKPTAPPSIIAPGPDVRAGRDQKIGDIMGDLFSR